MHLYESSGEPWLVLYYYVQSVELNSRISTQIIKI